MSKRLVVIAAAVAIIGMADRAAGQLRQVPNGPRGQVARSVGGWVTGGVAGGFGLGLMMGMGAFDEAINSDQKIWTSAIVGAVVGGTLGYLVGRARQSKSRTPSLKNGLTSAGSAPISETLVAQVAKSVTLANRSVVVAAHDAPPWTPVRGWVFAYGNHAAGRTLGEDTGQQRLFQ